MAKAVPTHMMRALACRPYGPYLWVAILVVISVTKLFSDSARSVTDWRDYPEYIVFAVLMLRVEHSRDSTLLVALSAKQCTFQLV